MSVHLVKLIDTKNFGAETVRTGDLNSDGAPELLFIQNFRPTREISCLTATDIYGNILWQNGTASRKNGGIFADMPVQIYDWDNDGTNEVLWVEQADYLEFEAPSYNPKDPVFVLNDKEEVRYNNERYVMKANIYGEHALMHVLDGRSGKVKNSFPIPAPADDSFKFVNLTGGNRRQDLIVKDTHYNIWGIAHNGEVLWQWKGVTGHSPSVADVDNDGMDEVFVGHTLIDHDGKELWSMKNWNFDSDEHADATYIIRVKDEVRLLFSNGGVHCFNVSGDELWRHPLAEGQHVVAGCFRPDLGPVQVAVINRGQLTQSEESVGFSTDDLHYGKVREPSTLYLYDINGKEIWHREQPKESWSATCRIINWTGNEQSKSILVAKRGTRPPAVYDGYGNIIDEMGTDLEGYGSSYSSCADVYGDSREEVILYRRGGCAIYANSKPFPIPTLYNFTSYVGM